MNNNVITNKTEHLEFSRDLLLVRKIGIMQGRTIIPFLQDLDKNEDAIQQQEEQTYQAILPGLWNNVTKVMISQVVVTGLGAVVAVVSQKPRLKEMASAATIVGAMSLLVTATCGIFYMATYGQPLAVASDKIIVERLHRLDNKIKSIEAEIFRLNKNSDTEQIVQLKEAQSFFRIVFTRYAQKNNTFNSTFTTYKNYPSTKQS